MATNATTPSLNRLPPNDTADPWFRPAWWPATSEWLCEAIADRGWRLAGPIDVVKIRPWAAVWRVPTDAGPLFLKAAARSQWHEPALVAWLARRYPSLLPVPVATDPGRGLLLTASCGPSLRRLEPEELHRALPLIEQTLGRLAVLQRDAAASVPELLAMGVPDRRPSSLPEQVAALLARPELLAPGDPHSMDLAETERVRLALPAIAALASELTAGPVPDSLDHGDLYLHHILPGTAGARVLDWGDATITHPFTLLLPLFHQLRTGFGLNGYHPSLERLRRAYLAPWASFGPTDRLDHLLDRALAAANLNRALNYAHALGPHVERLTPSMRRMVTQGVALWLREAMDGLGTT